MIVDRILGGNETHQRSVVKAISWRVLGSIDTFLLSWLFTGSTKAAGAIALSEVVTKMVLYYFHERAWAATSWGFAKSNETKPADATTAI